MEILKERYTITELSERLKITDHALRYYEREFKLTIPKDDRGRRYYTPELANVMFQIKTMRDEGLEIKAIKKLLQSENHVNDPPPVIINENTNALVPIKSPESSPEIRNYLNELTEQVTNSVSAEVSSAKDYLSKEINKTKLELGACFENNVRKLETKMEKHFDNVDRSIGEWRSKSKKGILKRFLNNFTGK